MFAKKLQCSQQQLADYLGVSRDLLGKVEIRQRQLPSNAALTLVALYTAMQENVFTGEPAAEGVEPLTSDAAQRYILSMNRQLAVARQKLAEFHAARNAALESLQLLVIST